MLFLLSREVSHKIPQKFSCPTCFYLPIFIVNTSSTTYTLDLCLEIKTKKQLDQRYVVTQKPEAQYFQFHIQKSGLAEADIFKIDIYNSLLKHSYH